MKFLVRVALFGLIMILLFAGCRSTPPAIFTLEDLAGTWLNEDYSAIGSYYDPKEVVTADGVVRGYSQITDAEPDWTYKISIVECWRDENGDIWFKCEWKNIGREAEVAKTTEYYGINKISVSGTVWESCLKGSDYPTELSPLGGGYTIHFRH